MVEMLYRLREPLLLLLATLLLFLLRRLQGGRKALTYIGPERLFVTKVAPLVGGQDAARRLFPKRYERHGHVVVVSMPKADIDAFRAVVEAFATSLKPEAQMVIMDVGGIEGELRRPVNSSCWVSQHLAPDRYGLSSIAKRLGYDEGRLSHPSVTIHVEGRIRYAFDVMRVMFASGNTEERMRFASIDAHGETVVDMFCGIGYFSVPLAKSTRPPHRIVCIEKNEDSIMFLRINAVLNDVVGRLDVRQGDCRSVADDVVATANRVVMGLIPTCAAFIPRALAFLRKNDDGSHTGVIHYHFLASKEDAARVTQEDISQHLVNEKWHVSAIHKVKSYAPRRYHFVADVQVGA